MTEIVQELMTPQEAAEWFRRSPTWLREQRGLLRLRVGSAQTLYHVAACRAYVLGQMCGLEADALRAVQVAAMEAACGLPPGHGSRSPRGRASSNAAMPFLS